MLGTAAIAERVEGGEEGGPSPLEKEERVEGKEREREREGREDDGRKEERKRGVFGDKKEKRMGSVHLAWLEGTRGTRNGFSKGLNGDLLYISSFTHNVHL